jgi:hypothetical protein
LPGDRVSAWQRVPDIAPNQLEAAAIGHGFERFVCEFDPKL